MWVLNSILASLGSSRAAHWAQATSYYFLQDDSCHMGEYIIQMWRRFTAYALITKHSQLCYTSIYLWRLLAGATIGYTSHCTEIYTLRASNMLVSTISARLQIVLLYISILTGHINDVSKYCWCTNHVWSSVEWTRTSTEVIRLRLCAIN